ncbi:hypothetical protein [Microbacterium sp. SLBN-146]|uniref:hypothetical protein n=1 Tax=Microbacterium sp. SLBN-146 TaxID=2768457 RepID=UPI001154BCCE|nr:hypothetical protein [Microbacterium sp. SLBN-146]
MMARIAGRSLWLAIPVGILSVAVVGALVWLAVPMIPVAVAWVGDSLRATAVAADEAADEPSPAEVLAVDGTLDCRDLYPDQLWAELIWHGDVLLSQGTTRPTIAAPELLDALAPTVRLSCSWALGSGGSISSALMSVAADSGPIVEASLAAQGFSCTNDDAGLTCTRSRGSDTESHVLRDGLWLSNVATGWSPDDYSGRLTTFIWP